VEALTHYIGAASDEGRRVMARFAFVGTVEGASLTDQ